MGRRRGSRGTGLGLSTSIGIIRSHGGFVRVETAPGEGSRFLVHLPAAADAGRPRPVPGVSARPKGNGELVLVVDDEADIRMMLDKVLTGSGYRVLEAANGAAAVAALRRTGTSVDVVLTDLTMPGMDGLDTVRALRDISPDLPIVLVSGLRPQTVIDEAANLGIQHVLSKPFSTATLLRTLGDVLKRG